MLEEVGDMTEQQLEQQSLTGRLYKNFDPDSTIKNRLGISCLSNNNNSKSVFMT